MSEVKLPEGIRYIKDPKLEPYFIQLDDYCYAVHKMIVSQESGKEYQSTVGFYSNFDAVLRAYAKNQVNSKSYESVNEFIIEYKSVLTKLESLSPL